MRKGDAIALIDNAQLQSKKNQILGNIRQNSVTTSAN
ncbi:MAG: hypothetical protein V7K46_03545 [Nostoc sp.]